MDITVSSDDIKKTQDIMDDQKNKINNLQQENERLKGLLEESYKEAKRFWCIIGEQVGEKRKESIESFESAELWEKIKKALEEK